MFSFLLTGTLNLQQSATTAKLPTANVTFGDYVSSILSGVMAIAAVLVLIFFLWGAIEWITSGGDSSKVQKARDRITQAIIGLLVLSSILALFSFIQSFLGIEVFSFGGGAGNFIRGLFGSP